MNVYLTGDTHGDFQRVADFCKRFETTKKDLMIVLGDAGLNFYLNYKDYMRKEFVQNIPITFLCIHGNHEERPYNVQNYLTKQFCCGEVYYQKEYPSILFAKDGEIYKFNNMTAIALGGAYSIDKDYRLLNGWPWFESEQPDDKIKARCMRKLDSVNWRVDVVLSHTVPLKYEPVEWFMDGVDQRTVDKSTEIWLDEIEDKLSYNSWFAGHYHGSKKIDKLRIMFEDFTML